LNRPILTLNLRIYSVPTIGLNAAIQPSTAANHERSPLTGHDMAQRQI